MQKNKKNLILQIVLGGIAFVYALAFFRIIMFKNGLSTDLRDLQLQPFLFLKELKMGVALDYVWLKNVLGNVAIFIPFSILVPCFFKKVTWTRMVLLGFSLSILVEIIQYILGFGCSDIDDVILNTTGVLIGTFLYFGLFARAKKMSTLVSALFLIVFGCCSVICLWLYQPGMISKDVTCMNEEVFEGVDKQSYDVKAICTDISNDVLYLKDGSVTRNDTDRTPIDRNSYTLSKNAIIILQEFSYTYAESGSIRETKISYTKTDKESLKDIMNSQDRKFCSIWLNEDGECERLVFNVYTN